MGMLDDFKAANPAYKDVDNGQLADALYNKYYAASMPRNDYDAKLGIAQPQQSFAQRAVSLLGGGENIENNPKENMNILGREMLSGVPVAGASVPLDDSTKQFEQDHPNIAKGMRVAGGTLAMVPAAVAAPELFGLAGTTGTRLAAGGLSGSTINAADTAARGGDLDEIKRSAITGGLTGMLPTVAGKIISPAIGPQVADHLASVGSRAIFGTAGYGAARAAGLTGHEGALMGLLMGETALKDPVKRWLTNDVVGNLARSLAQKGAQPVAAGGSNVIDLAKILSQRGPIQ